MAFTSAIGSNPLGVAALGATMPETFAFTATFSQPSPTLGAVSITQIQKFATENLDSGVPAFASPAIGQTHKIAKQDYTNSAPDLAGADRIYQIHKNISAIGVSAGAASFSVPGIIQVHKFASNERLNSAPVFHTPLINQVQDMDELDYTNSAPDLNGASRIYQTQKLLEQGHTNSAPILTTADRIYQIHKNISAIGFSAGAPAVPSASVTQIHHLAGVEHANSSPLFGVPQIKQIEVLEEQTHDNSAPILDVPSRIYQIQVLLKQDYANSQPDLNAASRIYQIHNIVKEDLSSGQPVLGPINRIYQIHKNISAIGVSGGVPESTSPKIGGLHVFPEPADVIAGVPTIATAPDFSQLHNVDANLLQKLSNGVAPDDDTAIRSVTFTTIPGKLYDWGFTLSGTNGVTLGLAINGEWIGQNDAGESATYSGSFVATGTTGTVELIPYGGEGVYNWSGALSMATKADLANASRIYQTHVLLDQDLDSALPDLLGSGRLYQVHRNISTSFYEFVSPEPRFSRPILDKKIGPFEGLGIDAKTPLFGQPAVGQSQKIDAVGTEAGVPVLSSPSVTHIHNVKSQSLSGSVASMSSPAVKQKHSIEAMIALRAPHLGQPALYNTNHIVPFGVDFAAPEFSKPSVKQTHKWENLDVAAQTPVLGAPVVLQMEQMDERNFTIPAPTIGIPSVKQSHTLRQNELSSKSPALGKSFLYQNQKLPVATGVDAGMPTIVTPAGLRQSHRLGERELTNQSWTVGLPTIVQLEELESQNYRGPRPTLGRPQMRVTSHFTAVLPAPRPSLGAAQFKQSHTLIANAGAGNAPVLTSPSVVIRHDVLAPVLLAGTPTVGQPTIVGNDHLVALGFDVGNYKLPYVTLHLDGAGMLLAF